MSLSLSGAQLPITQFFVKGWGNSQCPPSKTPTSSSGSAKRKAQSQGGIMEPPRKKGRYKENDVPSGPAPTLSKGASKVATAGDRQRHTQSQSTNVLTPSNERRYENKNFPPSRKNGTPSSPEFEFKVPLVPQRLARTSENISTPVQRNRHALLSGAGALPTPPNTVSPYKKVWRGPASGTYLSSSPVAGPRTPLKPLTMVRAYPTPPSSVHLPRLFGSPLADASFEVPDSQANSLVVEEASEPEFGDDVFLFSPIQRARLIVASQPECSTRNARTSSPRRPKPAPLQLQREDNNLVPSSQPDELDVLKLPSTAFLSGESADDEIVSTSQSQERDFITVLPRQRMPSSESFKSCGEVIPTSQSSEEELRLPVSPRASCRSPGLPKKLPKSVVDYLERTQNLMRKMNAGQASPTDERSESLSEALADVGSDVRDVTRTSEISQIPETRINGPVSYSQRVVGAQSQASSVTQSSTAPSQHPHVDMQTSDEQSQSDSQKSLFIVQLPRPRFGKLPPRRPRPASCDIETSSSRDALVAEKEASQRPDAEVSALELKHDTIDENTSPSSMQFAEEESAHLDSQDRQAPHLTGSDDWVEEYESYESSYSQSSEGASYPEPLKNFLKMFDRDRSPDE